MRRSLLLAAPLALLLAACNAPASQDDHSEHDEHGETVESSETEAETPAATETLTVPQFENAEFRLPIGDRDISAGFVTIRGADRPLTLVAVETTVAEVAELHTHAMVDGKMAMRKVDSFALPAGGTLELKPGGDHLMLFGVTQGLQAGESTDLVFVFVDEAGEEVRVTAAFPFTSLD